MTTQKPLLEWMRHGDPSMAPVLFGSPLLATANYLGIRPDEVTPAIQEQVAREIGMELQPSLGGPSLLDAVEFCPEIRLTVERTALPDGTVRQERYLRTPEGVLHDLREHPAGYGLEGIKEFFVKDDQDLPAFSYWIRRASKAVVEEPRLRARVVASALDSRARWSPQVVTGFGLWTPVFALTCTKYMGPAMAVYFIEDHPDLFEELMELYWQTVKVWLDVGVEVGADVFKTAINGLEWYSPALYWRYIVPQARQLFTWTRQAGRLSWLHTCGRMNRLIFDGAYDHAQRAGNASAGMGIDILESFSSPPLGDIVDLNAARARVGAQITTRGGIDIGTMLSGTPDDVRAEARRVLEATSGYRHMIGDTDSQLPGTPAQNMRAVVDVVREYAKVFH